MASVSVRNLSIRFGPHTVLQDLDLDVAEGEFLVLLGPSGCGKSTLLHSIAGLVDVHGGSVCIGGIDMTTAEPDKRGIGMVFQSYALYPTMTVERNMSFGLRVSGMPKAEIEKRVRHTAQMLQLDTLLQRKPSQLSGGQRQRVAIGRALVREAGVFLFDEPLSNLDAKLRTELRRELKLLHRNLRSTMIYVTHDQVEAMTLATRIVVMRGGKVQQTGAPGAVYELPSNLFVAGFLGAPGMNFIPGALSTAAHTTAFSSPDLTLDVSSYAFQTSPDISMPVILGLRPEHISLRPDGAWRGTVHLIEPMGNHRVVWLTCGSMSLSVVVHDAMQLDVGDSVRFAVDHSKISLFNSTTELRC